MLPAVLREHRVLIVCILACLVLVEYTWNLISTSLSSASSESSPVSSFLSDHNRPRWNERFMGDDQRQLVRAFDTLELSALEAENIALSQHSYRKWNNENDARYRAKIIDVIPVAVVNGTPPSFPQPNREASPDTDSDVKFTPADNVQIYAGDRFPSESMQNLTPTNVHLPLQEKQLCPAPPPALVGGLKVVLKNDVIIPADTARPISRSSFFQWPQLIAEHGSDLFSGGHFHPRTCRARQRVALVIPYRDRDQHLRIFINHIIPILKRQLLDFKVYVVEQNGKIEKFNRGALLNIGFVEALKDYGWQCVIFHDVDLLPENDRNLYMCDEKQPKHLSVAVDKFGYVLPYSFIMGGIEAFPVKTFRDINGFSNLYWGWGGEDDDLSKRIELHKPEYHLIRQDAAVARYKMIKHAHVASEEEPERFRLLNTTAKRMRNDGLSTLKYTLLKVEPLPLFTKLTVEIHKSDYTNKTKKFRVFH